MNQQNSQVLEEGLDEDFDADLNGSHVEVDVNADLDDIVDVELVKAVANDFDESESAPRSIES